MGHKFEKLKQVDIFFFLLILSFDIDFLKDIGFVGFFFYRVIHISLPEPRFISSFHV